MKKKPATLSDKINKLFEPDKTKDQSEESGDDTAPKFSEFDEVPDETFRNAALSEFRKRNIKFLEDFDRKYKGTVSSRKEVLDGEESETDADTIDHDESENDAEQFDDDAEDDGGEEDDDGDESLSDAPRTKSILFLKPSHHNDADSEASEDESAVESLGDDDESEDDQDGSFTEYLEKSKNQSKSDQITLIREENREETVSKGLAVQNQLKLWERMLEMRIKLQPCLITANSLPPADVCEKLRAESEEFRDKVEQVTETVAQAMDRFLELQETLLDRFSETKQLLKSGSKRKGSEKRASKSKRIALDEYEQSLSGRTNDMVDYRNSVLMKWHDRTKVASSVRNQKQTLSVLKKIEESLINRDELVRKTQLYRGGYTLFGRADESQAKISHPEEEPRDTPDQGPQAIYDAEIYDDSDFYHQLLRELIEYKTNTTDSPQEMANKLAELQKMRNKMKKSVDTRASKGRKIRYVVHNKLVNFMAPVQDYDWTDGAKDELFGSLFGRMPLASEHQ
ncbi:protein Aatf [Anopheles ziemanni]|uniref:protein Aatf n=1 Tax=Anopheles coustani TaxID=139045 RepID=UPI0026593247|nr:protein Aatf [Anopheles coustani]XP_058175466.1 protein Aatf [Anopheles ziemanni]